jgi:peptidyl-dipeptidase Dcp
MDFGPNNPFYAPSTLPFEAPPFDKISDSDYRPAIEAGMAEQRQEMRAIADNPSTPTFENTFVPMEKSGLLFSRAMSAFSGVTGANRNPELQKIQDILAPKLAAHHDAIFLDSKLFQRVAAVYKNRESLNLDSESLRLVDYYYKRFVHSGANLSDSDKAELTKLNEEESTLNNAFTTKLLAAAKAGAFVTTDKDALAGLTDAEITAAALAANDRKLEGFLLPLHNTTQQPDMDSLSRRSTRRELFDLSWNRAERGGENDTREIVARLAQLRAQKARLLGFPNFAAWKLEDQMAKTPAAALKFMDALVPGATARALSEAADIQAVIDSQSGNASGDERQKANPHNLNSPKNGGATEAAQNKGFKLEPWDWNFYAEQVRKAKYDMDEAEIRPFFELNSVLQNGVFYAATQLFGIAFKERNDIPVYHPDVQVFEVREEDGKPMALFYVDFFKRDNKNGGAWMSNFVDQSRLLNTRPVVYNVCNFSKPAPGEPALISYRDVTTIFHEFGHALHSLLSDTQYPSLSGTAVPRDFVELPSQFFEHWATYPSVFRNYAKHYKTGAPMSQELADKIKNSATFNQGYALTEVLAAAELDMQWHTLPADTPLQKPDAFETAALKKTGLSIGPVPPRYRSTYFAHIWGGDYGAGYYAYLWAEMLDHDAFHWFEENGGLTRANGERFRRMILSRGNTEELGNLYKKWRGAEPSIEPMLKHRGLLEPVSN